MPLTAGEPRVAGLPLTGVPLAAGEPRVAGLPLTGVPLAAGEPRIAGLPLTGVPLTEWLSTCELLIVAVGVARTGERLGVPFLEANAGEAIDHIESVRLLSGLWDRLKATPSSLRCLE